MKQLFTIVLTFFVLNLPAQERYSKVSIAIAQSDIKKLQQAGLEFDHGVYNSKSGRYITVLSSSDLNILRQQPFSFSMISPDETEAFNLSNKNENFYAATLLNKNPASGSSCTTIKSLIDVPIDFTEGTMGGYYTLLEIFTKVDEMKMKYPTLIQLDTIGYSYENRPLIVVKISDNASIDEDEPEVFEHALQHAREPMGMMHLIFFMQYILQHYDTDAFCKEIIDNRELYYLLCMNPDGYEYNRSIAPEGGGFHRKNRNPTYGKIEPIGVDLNRNYSVDWGYDNIGSSAIKTADTYRGPSAFSEPETQVIRNYVNGRKFNIHIDNHTFSNVFIYPYGVPINHTPQPADEAAFYGYTKYLLPRYNFFNAGTTPETLGYEVNGVSTDWYTAGDLDIRKKIFSYVSETGTADDGFWPLKSRIIPLAEEQLWHHFQLAYLAGSQTIIRDETPANIQTDNALFSMQLTQTGISGKPVQVTLIPLQNIAEVEAPKTILTTSFLQEEKVTMQVKIPTVLPDGSTVRYVWDCFTDGIHYYDTITRVYKGNTIFEDDMEGSFATNWTTNKEWFFANTKSYNGTQSMHDTKRETYRDNITNVVQCIKAFDLSTITTQAYLSFYTRYIAENGYDKMTLEVSENGSLGPYSIVCGSNTVTEDFGNLFGLPSYTGGKPGWVREWVDLSDYKNATNLSFRFRMTSDQGVTAEGFYIDDIQLVQATSSEILPIYISSFTVSKTNKYASLQWSGDIKSNFQYFEIERSADGSSFTTIGKVYSKGNSWNYLDKTPLNGINYYRIKQVATGEADTYTATRNISFANAISVSITPNPVQAIMKINVNVLGTSFYSITSAAGVTVMNGMLQQGINNINVQPLARGFYMIAVSMPDGKVEYLRFIKE